jgi:hypothetical protein
MISVFELFKIGIPVTVHLTSRPSRSLRFPWPNLPQLACASMALISRAFLVVAVTFFCQWAKILAGWRAVASAIQMTID